MKKMIFTSPRGKQVAFDDYEKEENDGVVTYWSQVCPTCHSKYRGIIGKLCSSGGSGEAVCGVVGCENANSAYYVDMSEKSVSFAN
jgi:hypothetical protein